MDSIKSIVQRRSCRSYTHESLKKSDYIELEKFISLNNIGIDGSSLNLSIFEKKNATEKMKIPYGLISGHKTYVFGKTDSKPMDRINYGYMLEKVVLKATQMQLGTCWVGMFDKEYFNDIEVESDLIIPSIVVIGYVVEKMPLKEKLIRKAVNADKRKPWESLFFNYETNEALKNSDVDAYVETISMTRLAPSSGNSQPWRIFYSNTTNEFHFFKKIINPSYEAKGMHDIDMGIAMSHFELVSKQNYLSGSWANLISEIKSIEDLHYIMSWKCI